MTASRTADVAGRCPDSSQEERVNLFPVPPPAAVALGRSGLSRRCMQRSGRRHRIREDESSAIAALNWCASQARGPTEATPAIHADIAARVAHCVHERGCPQQ